MSLEPEESVQWWAWTDDRKPQTVRARTEGLALAVYLQEHGRNISYGETIYIAEVSQVAEFNVGITHE